ncbi:hypothetical protein N657DRAFT_662423 [Parathielavia appendiculata]|uniref:Uncharacterized protein n=1 Tax=Parathielavia appendiculata TaxID=2587402 RepID=A0AAN6Z6K6_9PEZI|nr:hypothetical protein N657DRAFT_662423 [Parathielavia appendiculata]
MPVPVAAKVGIVAASVAVAAAIAIYEIPEVRRAAEDLRRRIAIALHSLGDNVDPNNPNSREPRFNRPEDAEGFYQTHDVDADEETRRRQREELMYWNRRRETEKQRHSPEAQQRPRGSTFDDFLQPDGAGESGTYVYNTGANAWPAESSNVLRRRVNVEAVRGLNARLLTNPFSDEYGIELEDRSDLLPPARDDVMSDIYNATPLVQSASAAAPLQPVPVPAAASEVIFDFASHAPSEYGTATSSDHDQHHDGPQQPASPTTTTTSSSRSATLDRELADDEYMTAGQDDRSAYASIQAWAAQQNASHNEGFYSPLPSTPRTPVSEPELISEGQLTPTDSASVAGFGVDVARDVLGESRGEDEFDVMSETDGGGGVPTPGSWSDVGSVVSESESLARA